MSTKRISMSFNQDEIKLLARIFWSLLRGQDPTVVVRKDKQLLGTLAAKFLRMEERAFRTKKASTDA